MEYTDDEPTDEIQDSIESALNGESATEEEVERAFADQEPEDTLEEFVEDLENCAIHLAICDEEGQVDPAEERYLIACIDHISNTHGIHSQALIQHSEEVQRLWKTRDNKNTASKHIDTAHQAFMSEISDENDLQY